jgi:hypothetical protein
VVSPAIYGLVSERGNYAKDNMGGRSSVQLWKCADSSLSTHGAPARVHRSTIPEQLVITACLLCTAQRSRCAAAGRAPHTTKTIASITIFTLQALVVKENILPKIDGMRSSQGIDHLNPHDLSKANESESGTHNF